MTARPEVQEHHGDRQASRALEHHREEVTRALASRPGFDIADLSDEEFDKALAREKLRQDRDKKIIMNDLVVGEDYGTVPGIPKPFAFEGSADKILLRMRWTARALGEPHITMGDHFMAASVTVGIFDSMDRVLHSVPRSCSTMERRFKNKGTGKWKFDDPAECLNEVVAMAFKRGKVAATLSAAAAKHFFSNPDQLTEDEDKPEPWTAEEKAAFGKRAKAVGLKGADEILKLIGDTIGRDAEGDPLPVHKHQIPALDAALQARSQPAA